ncbi:hypothetical protein Pjdr2_2706 [Paenibacillus sp. JDR-2]|nr:hypothetical protein Pjdr2_2706 [Paenibacillus sp. JDR-2]
MKWRRLLSILFITAFVVSLIPLLYLIEADKNNAYLSGLMFLTIVFCFLGVGSTITYYMIKLRN